MELCQCNEPGCVKARKEHEKWIEELYQQFKERLMDDLAVEAPDLRTYGILVPKPK